MPVQLQWNHHQLFTLPGMQQAVDAMFHRFGVLASGTAESTSGTEYDDQGSIENCPGEQHMVRLNRICIRRLVNIFLALYRHMHCWNARVEITPTAAALDCGIKLHHVLAASDDFSKLSMHWDLIPAAKISYVHDFRGLFNCISQVVYFHNPQYERRVQERKRISDVSVGANGIEMVQVIPSIMQMHPDILVEHEDTTIFAESGSSVPRCVHIYTALTLTVFH